MRSTAAFSGTPATTLASTALRPYLAAAAGGLVGWWSGTMLDPDSADALTAAASVLAMSVVAAAAYLVALRVLDPSCTERLRTLVARTTDEGEVHTTGVVA
jgi:hypothetical protein